MSTWTEIRTDYEEDNFIFVDAWENEDDNSAGAVIAKINADTKEVIYHNDLAKTDHYAQEIISEVIKDL